MTVLTLHPVGFFSAKSFLFPSSKAIFRAGWIDKDCSTYGLGIPRCHYFWTNTTFNYPLPTNYIHITQLSPKVGECSRDTTITISCSSWTYGVARGPAVAHWICKRTVPGSNPIADTKNHCAIPMSREFNT